MYKVIVITIYVHVGCNSLSFVTFTSFPQPSRGLLIIDVPSQVKSPYCVIGEDASLYQ